MCRTGKKASLSQPLHRPVKSLRSQQHYWLFAPVMSHRSFGSLASDAPLEGDTSVQNEGQTHIDLEDSDLPPKSRKKLDGEEEDVVQGFFGVRPWSIRLAPSVPAPIEDVSPTSGTSPTVVAPPPSSLHKVHSSLHI